MGDWVAYDVDAGAETIESFRGLPLDFANEADLAGLTFGIGDGEGAELAEFRDAFAALRRAVDGRLEQQRLLGDAVTAMFQGVHERAQAADG